MLRLGGEVISREIPSRRSKADVDRIVSMKAGLDGLRLSTDQDFGFDLAVWHEFLLKSDQHSDEYTHSYAWKGVEKRIREMIGDPDRLRLVGLCMKSISSEPS